LAAADPLLAQAYFRIGQAHRGLRQWEVAESHLSSFGMVVQGNVIFKADVSFDRLIHHITLKF